MDAILKEFNRLSKSSGFAKCEAQVDKFLEALELAKIAITTDPQNVGKYVRELKIKLDAIASKITDHEKEIYSCIAKYGKSLDKTFRLDLSSAYNPKMFPISPSDDLNRAMLVHFARNGHFEIAREFMDEAHVTIQTSLLDQFSIMYKIVQALKDEDLGPAIEWASRKREELLQLGSNLEFVLHKVQFTRLVMGGNDISVPFNYARKNLSVFGDRYSNEISRLMCSTLYRKDIERSPYQDIFNLPSYEKLAWMFSSEFCFLLGLSPESPIYLAVTAGSLSLPVLAKLDVLMKSKKAEWTTTNELPTEIPLPKSLIFHSIFVCPVSREQTTEENPPKVLPCGHILANNSLKSMQKDHINNSIKCPYCPTETTVAQTKRVYF